MQPYRVVSAIHRECETIKGLKDLLGNVERQIKGKVALLQVPTREQLAGKRAETVA